MTFQKQAIFGRTGLKVGRLGIASGYGIGRDGIELALEHGQNLLYWSSPRGKNFGRAIRDLAGRDRDAIHVMLQSYSRSARLLRASVEKALRDAALDRAEILILGFWFGVPSRRILDAALELKSRGLVRYLGVSSHSASLLGKLANAEWCDVIMARYNAAHRNAEAALLDPTKEIPQGDRPGIATFTATRWGHLLDPARLPPGEPLPRAGDCYRFALSHPGVDAVLTGTRNLAQMKEALAALPLGPLSEDERLWMRRLGDHLRRKHPFFP